MYFTFFVPQQLPLHYCQVAFRQSGQKILMIDEYGSTATCNVHFQVNDPDNAGLIDGWIPFCREKGLFEGLRIEVAVPCASPTIMSVIVKHVLL